MNLNTGFYKDLDTNFELAYEMSEKKYPHNALIEMLKNGNIPEKQIAALKLESVELPTDAEALISNLTGCDGKIREAVAFKICKILKENPEKREFFNFPEIFADASIDINGNICRLAIESAFYLKDNSEFSRNYTRKIFRFIAESFDALDKIIFRDKKYTVNKQLFKLYWCLEALKPFAKSLEKSEIQKILERTSSEREYTIREKSAELIVILGSDGYENLKKQLQNDENYYVRKAINRTAREIQIS